MDSRTAVRPVNRQRTGTAALALSVVSPCYNEEESIGELYRRLVAACRDVADPDTYEIVLVNDGSRDSTWERMQELARQDRHVVAVNLSRNHGHQLALSAGLSVCRGDRILIIDADLQDPPELLTKMMAAMMPAQTSSMASASNAPARPGSRRLRPRPSTGFSPIWPIP